MTKPSNIQKPLVSIILPVHNEGKTLAPCLKSLLLQTYRNIEIVAIDDCSTDDSYIILRKFRKRYKRLRISKNIKHYGLTTTLNRALRKAKGKFIAFMNVADESRKDRIQKQLTFLLTNPKTAIIGTQCYFVTEKRRRAGRSKFPIESDSIRKSLTNNISLAFESALINKYILPKDILKFDNQPYPFLFTSLFTKIMQFGAIDNLNHYLYTRTIKQQQPLRSHLQESLLPLLNSWIKSSLFSNARPPIRSLLFPLIKTP